MRRMSGDAVELFNAEFRAEALHVSGCPCIEGDHCVGKVLAFSAYGRECLALA